MLNVTKIYTGIVFAMVAQATHAQEPSYSLDVRPIISDMCFSCHGPDEKGRQGGLLLSDYESAVRGGDSGLAAITAGDPSASQLLQRIKSQDPETCMPPPHTNKKPTAEQIAILERWIASGAKYETHWAFRKPLMPDVPKTGHAHPLDAFVHLKRMEHGLSASQPADKSTLLRRVSFDLIGLPPTPNELAEFLADISPDAYEKQVDRLLDSPHYGERWARKWLDLARYADTNGYEKDRGRTIWPYRDWVIRALNADMPLDQFTIEQIAGDMIPDATLSQRIATGFHRNTMLNEEGGIDPLEFRYNAMVDRIATTGATWLGLTLQCAQCHTHKYDPITQREYYSLMAFLNNADELDLEMPSQEPTTVQSSKEKADALLASLPLKWPIEDPNMLWTVPSVKYSVDPPEPARTLDDQSVLFESPGNPANSIALNFPDLQGRFTHLRIEALVDDSLPSKGPGRTPHGNFVLSELEIRKAGQPIRIATATADTEQPGYPASAVMDSKTETGWAVDVQGKDIRTNKTLILTLDSELDTLGDTSLLIRQAHGSHHTIGRLRVSFGKTEIPASDIEKRRRDSLEKAFAKWIDEQSAKTARWQFVQPVKANSNLPLLSIQPDSTIFVSGDITKSDTYTIDLGGPVSGITAIRLEALPDPRLPARGPGMAYYEGPKGDFLLGEFQLTADGHPVKIASADQSYAKNHFGSQAEASYAIDGNAETGWSCAQGQGKAHEAIFRLEKPLTASNLNLTMLFGRHYACSLGRFRISITTDQKQFQANSLPAEKQELLHRPNLTESERKELLNEFLYRAPELQNIRTQIDQLLGQNTFLTSLVFQERPAENPRVTTIHHRGEWTQPTEPVSAEVLSALNPIPNDQPRNRLAFARWLVSSDNPLTARVVVNRAWASLFGRGIVKTQEDFGYQGSPPSHPELLDWLAVVFMEEGWSFKKLHRMLVTSATYKQSSHSNALGDEKDPENILLWRGPRVRLDAEQVRDASLRAAGLLSDKMFGPSVFPPQPPSVTTEGTYGAMNWTTSSGEDRYRRSLYTFAKRTAPYAFANTFDAPTGEGCIVRRDRSNTPLQALTMLNDVTMMESSQAMAKYLVENHASTQARTTVAYERCFSRPPSTDELQAVMAFHDKQLARMQANPQTAKSLAGDPDPQTLAERAAWTAVVRALMNTDEFITKR